MAGVFCAVSDTLHVIGTRPRLLIIQHLSSESRRFTDLKHMTKLSSRTLSINLDFLLDAGLVEKDNSLYRLTVRGKSLLPVLVDLGEWGLNVNLIGQTT